MMKNHEIEDSRTILVLQSSQTRDYFFGSTRYFFAKKLLANEYSWEFFNAMVLKDKNQR